MPRVEALFWRAVTAADFFTIERPRSALPAGGGGQSYLSISFAGLTHEELGRFLQLDPPSLVTTQRPRVELDVGVMADPTVRAPLVFAPRYQLPNTDDRYRITTQNRQTQSRHPAWRPARGFPRAPDDIGSTDDPRMPDLAALKVIVVRLDTGEYLAGYVNRMSPPMGTPAALGPLFGAYDERASAGVIEWESDGPPLEDLVGATQASARPDEYEAGSPEVTEALDETRRAAGRAPSGQGHRASVAERLAIERRSMEVARQRLGAEGWTRIEDVSLVRSYDFHCSRPDGRQLRIEVKGTTGDGSSVLLTPNEVAHARDRDDVALLVVSCIELDEDADGSVVAGGGDVELVVPWDIDAHGDLRATGFEYRRHR